MLNREKLTNWLINNKQIGKTFSFEQNNELCWSSVGIQIWEGVVKVYVDEILESQMDAENYLREEILAFPDIDSALNYVADNTKAPVDELTPCKGQKIFNPKFGSMESE